MDELEIEFQDTGDNDSEDDELKVLKAQYEDSESDGRNVGFREIPYRNSV